MSIRLLRIIMVVIMGLCLCISPVLAQSDLLPEKSLGEEIAVSSQDNANSSDSASESNSWIYVTSGMMGGAFLLLFMEIVIIPGFGICGISGVILLLAALGLAFWKLSYMAAILTAVTAVLGVIATLVFVFVVFPKTKMGKTFILKETAPMSITDTDFNDSEKYVGLEGVAISNLRPSGIAKIGDDRVDVITEGDFVEKGTPVKVIKAVGGRVIVVSTALR